MAINVHDPKRGDDESQAHYRTRMMNSRAIVKRETTRSSYEAATGGGKSRSHAPKGPAIQPPAKPKKERKAKAKKTPVPKKQKPWREGEPVHDLRPVLHAKIEAALGMKMKKETS